MELFFFELNCIATIKHPLCHLNSGSSELPCTLGNSIQHGVSPKLFSYTPLGDGGFSIVQSPLQKQTGFNVNCNTRNQQGLRIKMPSRPIFILPFSPAAFAEKTIHPV